jgi:hypothetical protein
MEWTDTNEDADFRRKAVPVPEDELESFESGTITPLLSKPVKFDLNHGGGKWNNRMCLLLALECEKALKVPEPRYRVSKAVQLPQLEALMRKKYRRAWDLFSPTTFRGNETRVERDTRIINQLDKNVSSKRAHSSRVKKFNTRMAAITERIERGESVKAMRIAKHILRELGEEGMSSEEEIVGDDDEPTGFRVSNMVWRNNDIGRVLHMVDNIYEQIKGPQGAKPLPRYRGNTNTRRRAKEHMGHQFYDRDYLEERGTRGRYIHDDEAEPIPNWSCYEAWEGSLGRVRNW